MKRWMMASVLALAGLVAANAQSVNQTANQNLAEAPTAVPAQPLPASGNTLLTGKIMQRLTDDPLLGKVTLTASVGENGAVTLNGVVNSDALAQRAVQVVQSVPGVSSVKSQILVNQDPFAPPPAAENFSLPIETTPPPPLAAKEPQALIADALSKVPQLDRVSGSVYGDTVSLIGTVRNPADIQTAVKIAQQTLPNFKIKNYLWVDAHPLSPPPMAPPAAALGGGSAGN